MTPLLAGLLALVLRSTVVLGVALGLASSLRGRSAGTRHRLLTLAGVGLLSLPFLPAVLPRLELRFAPWTLAASSSPVAAPPRAPRALGATAGGGAAAATRAAGETPVAIGARSERPSRWTALVSGAREPAHSLGVAAVVLWSAGSALSVLGLAVALRRERRMRASSRPLGEDWTRLLDELRAAVGVSRRVRLLASPEAGAPMTHGWRRPIILLPSAAEGWSDERKRVVLQHELVHVARGDALRHLIWRATVALYWFHPLTRIAAREASVVGEHACDEAVVDLGTRPSTYARHLLEIAESVAAGRRPIVHALPMVEPSQLARRLHMILDDRRKPGPGQAPAAVALLAGAVALVAAASPVSPAGPTTAAIPTLAVPAAAAAARSVAPSEAAAAGSAPRVCGASIRGSFSGTIHDGPAGEEWAGSENGDFTLQQNLSSGRRLCARVNGAARLDEKDGSIRELPAGSSVTVETRGGSGSQVMRVAGASGGPRYEWWVGGASRPVDEAAKAWLADALMLVAGYRAIGSIQGQVGGLQGEIGGIQGQVGGLQGEIGGIQGRIGGLQGQVGSIEGERGALEGRIGGEEGAIGALEGRRWQADAAEKARIDAEIASHRVTIEKLRAEMKSRRFEERIAEAEQELKAHDAKGQAEIADLERRIADLHADEKIAQLNRKIEDLHAEDRIAEIERRMQPVIERLGSTIDRLRS